MKFRVLAALVALGATLTAQIPCSDFVRTYSAAQTRGFLFQAPTDFVVYALQVPDELKKGQYHAALYRTAANPTTLPTTSPVFLATSVKSGTRVLVLPPLKVKKGEWLGVLGAAGPTTGSLDNSYGAVGPVSSHVLGLPVKLDRMMLQSNLVVSKGVGQVYTNVSNIARIRVYVVGHGEALPYGTGGTTKSGSLLVSDNTSPSIGKTSTMVAVPGDPNNLAGLLLLGAKKTSIPTPFGNLLTWPLVGTLPLAKMPATGLKISLPIPNDKGLLGAQVFCQVAELQGTKLVMTSAMQWTINN